MGSYRGSAIPAVAARAQLTGLVANRDEVRDAGAATTMELEVLAHDHQLTHPDGWYNSRRWYWPWLRSRPYHSTRLTRPRSPPSPRGRRRGRLLDLGTAAVFVAGTVVGVQAGTRLTVVRCAGRVAIEASYSSRVRSFRGGLSSETLSMGLEFRGI